MGSEGSARARTAIALALAPVLALACGPAPGPAPALERFDFEEPHFGDIPVELTLYAPDEATALAAAEAAFARVAELSAMMSDYAYDPPSPLNRIAVGAPDPVEVPPELMTVIGRAMELGELTEGAFDVTAKPLVQLWRVSRLVGELPPAAKLREAAGYVGLQHLSLDHAASTVRLAREGMWLDLGGIAKGFVGDEVVRLLYERGLPHCRYSAGGDMVFGDAPPGEQGWPVHVPDLVSGGAPLSFELERGAASVSGDVYRFVEIDGRRYSHVVDPRAGLGVTTRRISCVRGRRGIDTDALATAGVVLDDVSWQAALARVPGTQGDSAVVGDARED